MKKIIILLLILLPLNVLAYSNRIIPGGQTVGIEVENEGIIIIGFYRVNGKLNQNNLRVGDIITHINGKYIDSIDTMLNLIEENINDNKVNITLKRDNKVMEKEIIIEKVDGTYKTGLYIKNTILGIGTLTYIDPNTRVAGMLGHEVLEGTTNKLIEVKTGNFFRTCITSIDKSVRGIAGTKNAKFYNNINYGTIKSNSNKGLYGIYNNDITDMDTMEVANYSEIELGSASIRTVINKEEVKEYQIYIDKINNNSTKNIHFKIISPELIEKTGGIVQGMSGSPIIQNNKIIGAVTHVVIDNPETGYGILITNMLDEGDKIIS